MNKEYVKTSDTPYAAYLMLNGYTLLDCIDTGKLSPFSGKPCFDFYLTHSDESIRTNIQEHANELRDFYQNESKGFREFFLHIKLLNRKARSPRKLEEYGEY